MKKLLQTLQCMRNKKMSQEFSIEEELLMFMFNILAKNMALITICCFCFTLEYMASIGWNSLHL